MLWGMGLIGTLAFIKIDIQTQKNGKKTVVVNDDKQVQAHENTMEMREKEDY
jgi:hypothetical protein